MQVLIPEIGSPPFPTLYLLHPLNDDRHAWMRETRIESLATSLPLVVVMPDGDRGFYTDNEEGPAYARHIGEELVNFVERTFPVVPARSGRAIGGVSMGGYGALRVGLGYPDRFCSIHSHSGSLDRDAVFSSNPTERSPTLRQRPESFIAEMRRIFGERPQGTSHDVLRLARDAKEQGRLPELWIDCGTDDYLIGGTRAFHRELEAAGISHVYREHPGAHDWQYVNRHLEAALAFHAQNLGVSGVASRE